MVGAEASGGVIEAHCREYFERPRRDTDRCGKHAGPEYDGGGRAGAGAGRRGAVPIDRRSDDEAAVYLYADGGRVSAFVTVQESEREGGESEFRGGGGEMRQGGMRRAPRPLQGGVPSLGLSGGV